MFVLSLFSSCQENERSFYQTIDNNAQTSIKGSILFSKGKESYLYDLKITEHFCVFLDNQSDTVVWIFRNKDFREPFTTVRRTFDENGLWNPSLTKEALISSNKADEILLVDNNLYFKKLELDTSNNFTSISTLYSNRINTNYSTNFNHTIDNIYAIPIHRRNKKPFYFFNSNTGFNWAEPASQIETILPQDVLSFINTISLNEELNSVVSAYRFTNSISFYNLEGSFCKAIQLGKDPIIPIMSIGTNNIDIENTTKCFIHIYGTPKHVYCLYDGSSHFTNHSKIAVFKWNGKHVTTWQVDRNLRAIAVDNEDKYILGISSNENGQDIIKYDLE